MLEPDRSPLTRWLIDLVGEDKAARFAAAEALGEAWLEAGGGERGPFVGVVRAAVEGEGFPKAAFVRRLCLYRIALADDWRRRCDHSFKHPERPRALDDPSIRRGLAGDPDAERLVDRYARLLDDPATEGRNMFEVGEGIKIPATLSYIVLGDLDDALLADRAGLLAMLRYEPTFDDAARALARIGPAAVGFAGFLLDRLDEGGRFPGAYALGEIGRDDPATVDALLDRLRRGDDARRVAAASTLKHAGPGLVGREDEAVRLLIGATEAPGYVATVSLSALASVGRHREDALRRILDLAAPGPSDEATVAGRAAALEGLGHFTAFPDRAVPPLIAAIDDFEEYDTDYFYGGDHARVCDALASFGPAAAPAVPRLIALLDEWSATAVKHREWPKDVLNLLAAIGPPAAPALPRLDRLRLASSDDVPPDDLDPDGPLDRAILAVRSR